MKTTLPLLAIALFFLSFACREVPAAAVAAPAGTVPTVPADTLPTPTAPDYDTTQWTELNTIAPGVRLDMRYATTDNFVGQVLYDCARCFVRPAPARALADIQAELQTQGLGLKLFDCYRPRAVQWKLWEIYPKPGYVADPRTGSVHNRGGAVDLTLVDSLGQELDMGTAFDFFGPKANHTFTELPANVLANRRRLKDIMRKHGFTHIRSEWWHYEYAAERYELADEVWPCVGGQ